MQATGLAALLGYVLLPRQPNDYLTDVDKFTDMRSTLVGGAADVVLGLRALQAIIKRRQRVYWSGTTTHNILLLHTWTLY